MQPHFTHTAWVATGVPGTCNVALNGVATQINTLGGYIAGNCIDGSLQNICHPSTSSGIKWWEVDLQTAYPS